MSRAACAPAALPDATAYRMVAMRIATGHLNHEVTIFSPLWTTLEEPP